MPIISPVNQKDRYWEKNPVFFSIWIWCVTTNMVLAVLPFQVYELIESLCACLQIY